MQADAACCLAFADTFPPSQPLSGVKKQGGKIAHYKLLHKRLFWSALDLMKEHTPAELLGDFESNPEYQAAKDKYIRLFTQAAWDGRGDGGDAADDPEAAAAAAAAAKKAAKSVPVPVGTVVWAKVQGYPWWPGRASQPQSSGGTHIYFFGEGTYALCKNTQEWEGYKEKALADVKNKSKKMQQDFHRAVELAEKELPKLARWPRSEDAHA